MKRPYQIDPRPTNDFMWLPGAATQDQVMDQLETMRRMETTTYRRRDYLYSSDSPYKSPYNSPSSAHLFNDSNLIDTLYVLGPVSPPTSVDGSSSSSTSSRSVCCHPYINETTRQNMIDLLYEIADYCHFRRETVAYAIWNIMDRFLSLPNHKPLETKIDFQLIASTSLYIAVKLLEPVSMDVQSLAELSKGAFESLDILEMEKHMLFSLKWAVSHGPTPVGFVQLYLSLLQMDGRVLSERELWDNLMEQAQYQVELSVVHYHLATSKNPSEIALAAVWNALESQLDRGLATQWQEQLVGYLTPLELGDAKDTLPKIQLTLCKLQYASDAHFQERQQAARSAPSQSSTSSTASTSQDYHEDEDQLPEQQPQRPSLELDVTERREEEDDDGNSARYLFPSPVSVAINQLSYEQQPKAEKRDSASCYGLSYLKSFFSSN